MRLSLKLANVALAGAMTAGLWAASTATASAEVVCNRWNECWRVHEQYDNYPPRLGIVFHDDHWRGDHWRRHHYRWRHDRDGRGYYRNGIWIGL